MAGFDYYEANRKKLVETFKDPRLNWLEAIDNYLYIVPSKDYSVVCVLGSDNDRIGNLIKFYEPPGQSYEPIGYGAGAHTNVVSDNGDFTLRYTITFIPPPNSAVEKQLDSNTFSNRTQLNNNIFTFNKTEAVK